MIPMPKVARKKGGTSHVAEKVRIHTRVSPEVSEILGYHSYRSRKPVGLLIEEAVRKVFSAVPEGSARAS
jgi:hypothetical protein